MQPDNPIVGGTVLRRPAIQSPNYVAGTSGWTINADGSAEFNNVDVRGIAEVHGTDGSYVKLTTSGGAAVVSLSPATTTYTWFSPGFMYANAFAGGAGDLFLQSPTPNPGGIDVATVILRSNDNVNDGTLVQLNAPGTNGMVDLESNGTGGSIKLSGTTITITAAGTLTLSGTTIIATPITANVSNAAETWHTLTLTNGWSGTLKYRLVASPPNCVQIISGGLTPGTKANGTVIGTLPVGYQPASGQDVSGTNNNVVAGGESPHWGVGTNGNISCWGMTSATLAGINCLISLDF